ncbi:hypothetical protein CABS01_03318 [Colletotrichum abscissum]|uniref:Uncharacterized protein n=1 Tax=Colletotrichum costaricense TaxID=1209916 RepID=A0AAI9ZCX2_9PEZI|nr:uncharacterized protein CCOS01_01516 [Colletotrichum costaricense]XP_060392613.1 uncharacterized protein CABS01_03318 [Colletotrichum abscissum]KAI3544818.1 hypothetical protein CSPX01_05337 [Colletotrichum filicis]KAK1478016.1 hypothetical protein CABS01_03318 [Colletotrichum abscissum]KAK1540202.1 hypothetical protein CCOS01_01516 [Colletotrichum costaricense]
MPDRFSLYFGRETPTRWQICMQPRYHLAVLEISLWENARG